MNRPQTIQVYLPFGEPQGIRQAEITTRTVRAFDVPRADLKNLGQFPEASQPGVYVLVGEDSNGDQVAYIGESDNVVGRLRTHNSSEASGGKDFWQRAVLFVSLTNTWTKAHVRYLERLAFERARNNGSLIKNSSLPVENVYLPKPLEADCIEYFETIEILLATLGFSVLREPIERSGQKYTPYRCKPAVNEAHAYYTNEGMLVREGSYVRAVEKGAPEHQLRFRTLQLELLEREVIVAENDRYKFASDYMFKSPSAASGFVLGRSSNGWTDWIDPNGRTLSQNERSDNASTGS